MIRRDKSRLAQLPTPFERLPRFSAHFGRGDEASSIWIKRDDCTGFAGGGNKVPRHTGHLTLKGPTLFGSGFFAIRETVREWAFYDAFPVRWSGPTLSASASDVATETLEIAHHGFRTTD